MKHSIKFTPERRKDKAGALIIDNVPLFADIRFSSTRMYYFTGYRINIIDWDEAKEQLKKNKYAKEGTRPIQYNIVNSILSRIIVTLDELFLNAEAITKLEITSALNKVCKKAPVKDPEEKPVVTSSKKDDEFFTMFELYHKEAKISEARRKHVKSVMNHWQRYAEVRRFKPTFHNIDLARLRDFENYLATESRGVIGNGDKLVLRPKGNNTIHEIMAKTRTFFNFARKELKQRGVIIPYPFEDYSLPTESYGNPIYITSQERNKLYDLKLNNEKLSLARDMFLFQSYTGPRIADFYKLTVHNIHNDTLSYIQSKRKGENPVTVRVPIHDKAKAILKRYNEIDGRLFPYIPEADYNELIKLLFKVAGITRVVTRLNPNTGEPEQVHINTIASSHMARRTFIGNLYGKVDRGIISSMSGHAKSSKAFDRYYDVAPELQQQAVNLMD